MLLSKGYPDIGWNPCGGEKYLDFLRFAVFVNGAYKSSLLRLGCGGTLWVRPKDDNRFYRGLNGDTASEIEKNAFIQKAIIT